jgi:multiple sugar transport system ATP-binding protein
MTTKLKLSGVSKRFGERDAVRDLSLELASGEFLSLLGPSGCGKSTTLAMIAGFILPDAGDIMIDGIRINDLSPRQRRVGLVLQDYAVFTSLSVRANLAFGLEVKGLSRRKRSRVVDELARRLDILDLLDRRGGSLNMSEMQRVALARTLAVEPDLLLLDEPMSNLDAEIRARLRGELRQLQQSLAQSVLYVTHDQAEALSMSDRVVVMRDGEIVQVGTPEEIYRRPTNRFVAEFVGDPPLNVIPCDVTAGAVMLTIALPGGVMLDRSVAHIVSGRHWLGVRPHDIELVDKGTAGAIPAVLRFVEDFGARHVLHAEYADGALLRVEVLPNSRSVGETLHLLCSADRALLIERNGERVIPLRRLEDAA